MRSKRVNIFIGVVLLNGLVQVVLAKPTAGLSLWEISGGLLLILTIYLFVLKQLRGRKALSFLGRNGVLVLVLTFLLAAYPINFVLSYVGNVPAWEWLKGGYGYAGLGLIFIVFEEIKREEDINHLFMGLMLLVILSISIELIVSFASPDYKVVEARQIEGRFKEFRPSAATIVVGIAMSCGVILNWARLKRVEKAFLSVFILIILIRTAIAGSKFLISFVLFGPLCMIALLWLLKRSYVVGVLRTLVKCMGITIATLFLCAGVIWSKQVDYIIGNFGYRFARIGYSVEKRVAEQKAAIEFGYCSPILGNGFGSTFSFYRPNVGLKSYDHVHNIFIQLFKDGGAVLVGLYVISIAAFLRVTIWKLGRCSDRVHSAVLVSSLLVIIGLLLCGQVSTILKTQTANFFLATFMGMALALTKRNIRKTVMRKEHLACRWPADWA